MLAANIVGVPCWVKDAPPCSWNPWTNYSVKANGGVPQRANLSLHLAQFEADLNTYMPDADSQAIAIFDWEMWRIPASVNYDELSLYVRYSEKLVQEANPSWTNATKINEEAAQQFNTAGNEFFLATLQLAADSAGFRPDPRLALPTAEGSLAPLRISLRRAPAR